MDKRYFPDKIVKWYLENKRELPWRDTIDPYKIWLSEIILQQTRVSQGLPYYLRFISQYPTVHDLAKASENDVLRSWQGLGYYTRARNLHKCAKVIVEISEGIFPKNFAGLLDLPGIGEYTAAAIASFSYREPVAVVDGNVFRVLSRVFGIETPINSPEGKKIFTTLANELIPKDRPDLYNQAVMEFGAMFCTPKNPNCTECVFQKKCFAFQNNLQQSLPVKLKLQKSRKRYFYYFVFEDAKKLVMKKRGEKDIWMGLFDFHLIERKKPVKPEQLLRESEVKSVVKGGKVTTITEPYKHVLTHQTIFSTFIIIKGKSPLKQLNGSHALYSMTQIGNLPKPVLVSRFLNDHYVL